MKKKNPWNPKQFEKSEFRGDSDSWSNAAKELRGEPPSDDLQALGLEHAPQTLRELQRARNHAMLTAHPDRGGSNELAQRVQTAYENLKRNFT